MHISGKIFTWLIVVLAAGALWLTLRLFDVRNNWSQRVMKANDEIAANEEQIRTKQQRIGELERQYTAQLQVLGKYWHQVDANPAADGQTVTLANLGTDLGLGRAGGAAGPVDPASQPRVFLFGVQPGGQTFFVGDFGITQLGPKSATLFTGFQYAQGLRPETWRVRIGIPEKHRARVADLQNQIVTTATDLQDTERNLATAQGDVEEAKQILARREAELNGDANAQLPGLIADVAQAEQERNAELAELQRLRREVQQIYARRADLVETLTTQPVSR